MNTESNGMPERRVRLCPAGLYPRGGSDAGRRRSGGGAPSQSTAPMASTRYLKSTLQIGHPCSVMSTRLPSMSRIQLSATAP
jgi:hypothetical protein